MKKFMCILLALFLLAALPLSCRAEEINGVDVSGFTGDYDKFKGQNITINVYNWGEYISEGSDGESLDVNQLFEELTGIHVNYLNFATNEELYAKLKAGGADYDVIFPSDYMISRMIEEDMLEKLDFSNIPNYANISDNFKNMEHDPNNEYCVPYMWGTVGIVYNTTMVEEAPDSWDALWDERYAGQILMFSNPRDAFGIAQFKLGYSVNTTDPVEIEEAAAELRNQKPLVAAYVMDEIFDKMGGGEAALAPYYAGDAITMMEENPDLAFVVPKEGTNLFSDAMCIPKGAKNKEAAELYINFMCEGPVALANSEYIGYSSPNEAALALMDEEMRNNKIAYPDEGVLDNTEPFLNLDEESNVLMSNLWTYIISSNDNYNQLVMPAFVLGAVALSIGINVARSRRRKPK